MKPKPDFTIEELLQEAITRKQEDDTNVFRATELAELWGFQTTETVYKHMDKLAKAGWQFLPAKKYFRDRVGRETFTNAYRIIPPMETKQALE